MEKITGIGGVFFKAKDHKALCKWYDENLGTEFGENTYLDFAWVNQNNPEVPGHTVFSFFEEETKYFTPSVKPFMINFRVKNLDAMMAQLKANGVEVMEKTEDADYGKFGWCRDLEGNKIELWQPME